MRVESLIPSAIMGGAKKSRQDATRLVHLADERAREASMEESRKRQASRALSRGLDTSPDPPAAIAAPQAAPGQAPAAPQPPAPGQGNGGRPATSPKLADALQQLQAALSALQQGQAEHRQETAALRAALERADGRAQAAEQRAKAAEDRAAQLEAKFEGLLARADQRQEGMDRTMRKANMIFNGLPEEAGLDLQAQVQAALRAVACSAADKVVDAVRFGARDIAASAASTRVRPVRVAFSSPTAVYEVFKTCKALREQRKVFVDRDLTVQQRAALLPDYRELHEGGKRLFWRAERLYVPGEGGGRPSEIRAGERPPAQASDISGASGARRRGAPSPHAGEQRASPSAASQPGPSA